jgi:N-dimethylarginine dimethylaminohydrolase
MATRAAEVAYGSQSMIAPLRRVLVHMPSEEYNQEGWTEWGFAGSPDRELACEQHAAFAALLEGEGTEISWLEEHSSVQTTATYDPALVTNEGAVMMKCGRPERWPEVMPMARKLLSLDIPIIGWIRGEGRLDGGDTLWLDERTLLVAQGYRSNLEGYRQLRLILDGVVDTFHHFELPHWEGVYSVLHLMSVVNLCSEDVALIYPRAMPIGLMRLLKEREYTLVECPDEEFNTQGCNLLALRPGVVVMCAGNPTTSSRLREAGIEVLEYEGSEISVRRISGPTCNTRPLLRA